MLLHTAGSWEEDGGKVYIESSRLFYNVFPVMGPPTDTPFGGMQADYVRWELDVKKPSNTKVADPAVLLEMPGEMARMDERFLTRPYNRLFCPVVVPGKSCLVPPIVPIGLNGYMMLDKSSGKTTLFDPGLRCTVEDPIFIPRSGNAPEGDGWVLGMVQRLDVNRSDLVVLDTNNFVQPVAVVQLPFRTKGQIHGNWVDAMPEAKSLVRTLQTVEISGRGALSSER